jgi:hypothetical protein
MYQSPSDCLDRKPREEFSREDDTRQKPRIDDGIDAKTKIEELRAFYQKKYSTAKKGTNDSPSKQSSSGAYSKSALKSPTYDTGKYRLGSVKNCEKG